MSWVKQDDGYFHHDKVVGLSKDAKLLDLAAKGECSRALTDGFVSCSRARIAAAVVDVADIEAATAELVIAKLWEVAPGGGWTIHDYLDHNPSAASVKAKREAAQQRMQRARSRERRENRSEGSQDVPEKFNDPVPHPLSNGVPRNTLSKLPPQIRQAVEVWNEAKARRQPSVRSCPPELARWIREFLHEIGDDVDAWRRAVCSFAADPFMNGQDERASKARGLDTMVRKSNRAKWIIAAQAEPEPSAPRVVPLTRPEPITPDDLDAIAAEERAYGERVVFRP